MKKVISILLFASVLLTAFSGCQKSTSTTDTSSTSSTTDTSSNPDTSTVTGTASNVNKEGFPIVNEPLTLNFVGAQSPVQSELKDIAILKNFEEKSGITINWTSVPWEFVAERRNIIMASGDDLPDAFFKMNFPGTDVSKYATQGSFQPIDGLIDDYAPNISAAFEQWPDVKAGLTAPDGHIYSLSYILGAPAITSGGKLFFNQEALDQIDKELPTTLDEYTEVLRAFKTLDYNGNGKNDEIPLTASTPDYLSNIFMGSFALKTRGGIHAYVDIDPETNKPRLMQSTDNYKELLQYFNMLYKEGLLDQEIFTADMPKLIAKGEEGRALSYTFVNHAIIGTKYSAKSIGATQPLEGNYGRPIVSSAGSSLSGMGNFIITADNQHPEATIRWVDYWYSDEGNREYFMGIEGETYTVDDQGTYQYTDFVMNNPDGIMFEQVLGSYVPWAGGANPSIASEKYFKGGEMQPISKTSADAQVPFRPETIWPTFTWSEEYVDDIIAIETDLKTYCDENRALFITGKRSFDEWDDYVKGFESLQVEKYLEMYEKTYERYEA